MICFKRFIQYIDGYSLEQFWEGVFGCLGVHFSPKWKFVLEGKCVLRQLLYRRFIPPWKAPWELFPVLP